MKAAKRSWIACDQMPRVPSISCTHQTLCHKINRICRTSVQLLRLSKSRSLTLDWWQQMTYSELQRIVQFPINKALQSNLLRKSWAKKTHSCHLSSVSWTLSQSKAKYSLWVPSQPKSTDEPWPKRRQTDITRLRRRRVGQGLNRESKTIQMWRLFVSQIR